MVMPRAVSGYSGIHRCSSSSSRSVPCSTNRMIAAAVNCFVSEPMRHTLRGVAGISFSRSARPWLQVTSGAAVRLLPERTPIETLASPSDSAAVFAMLRTISSMSRCP